MATMSHMVGVTGDKVSLPAWPRTSLLPPPSPYNPSCPLTTASNRLSAGQRIDLAARFLALSASTNGS
jgi:hypothetical protein